MASAWCGPGLAGFGWGGRRALPGFRVRCSRPAAVHLSGSARAADSWIADRPRATTRHEEECDGTREIAGLQIGCGESRRARQGLPGELAGAAREGPDTAG